MKISKLFAGPAKFSLIFFAFAITVIGCQTQGPEFVDDYDVVATTPDRDFNFGDIQFYFMPDTVVFINDSLDDEISDSEDAHRFDDEILAAVARNMQEKGYERLAEDDPLEPDVFVFISTLKSRYIGVYWWSSWWSWWGWGGWWGSGWNPWYPWGGTVYTWSTGTVIIDIVDPIAPPVFPRIPAVWNAMFNGLISGSDESILRRIETNIDQAFIQSDYLGRVGVSPQ